MTVRPRKTGRIPFRLWREWACSLRLRIREVDFWVPGRVLHAVEFFCFEQEPKLGEMHF